MTTTESRPSETPSDTFETALDRAVPRWSTRPPLGYLPGLDGIRAISVLAVIAYHLDYEWAAGGYLGVEVFFVLSGFLITRLLLDEEWRTGAISRPNFWLRRARRLLPAVVALIVGVWAWAVFVLPPGEAALFRGDAFASLLYVQNWHAIIADQPYFASFGRPSPFRHLWSLAIEEQFYLLWPLLLPVTLRRWGRRRTAALIVAGVVASVLLMQATADIAAPERAYYGTDTRAFGILLGALLAFGWTPERLRPERLRTSLARPARWIIDAAGVGASVVLLWQFAGRSEFDPWTYPQGFLLVDLATIVLLVSATHPLSSVHRALGTPVLAGIGRRSYSIYLWHWPVIVFTQPEVDWGLTGPAAFAVRAVLVVALSEVSYRLIERPFRDGRVRRLTSAVSGRIGPLPARRLAIGSGAVAGIVLLALLAVPSPNRTVETTRAAIGPATTLAPVTIAPAPPSTSASAPTTSTTASSTTSTAVPDETTVPGAPLPPISVPPDLVGPEVTVIGESVTLGAAGTLQGHYGDRIQIDAIEGRQANEAFSLIVGLAQTGRLTPTVIIHVGNNGALTPGKLDDAIRAIGPDRRVVMVSVRVPRRWEEQVNNEVLRVVDAHDNVVLADWNLVSDSEPELLGSDGIHLTARGKQVYSQMLIDKHP